MAKGSHDWLLGWNDHAEFIGPYRRKSETMLFFIAFALGFVSAAVLLLP